MAGGSLGGGGRRRMITDINVTPLVDIMLVLLIIFMVTATYIVKDAIEVKLPEASTGESKKVSILAVTLDAAGRLSLNGEPATEQRIRNFIREQRQQGVSLEAVIAADRNARHGQVVGIIDLVRAEGVMKFAINVLKKEG
jgi:biopolymer transport protein ExbD